MIMLPNYHLLWNTQKPRNKCSNLLTNHFRAPGRKPMHTVNWTEKLTSFGLKDEVKKVHCPDFTLASGDSHEAISSGFFISYYLLFLQILIFP